MEAETVMNDSTAGMMKIPQDRQPTPLDELQNYAAKIKSDSASLLALVEQLVQRVVGIEPEAPDKVEVAKHSGIVHLAQHDLEGVRWDLERISTLIQNI